MEFIHLLTSHSLEVVATVAVVVSLRLTLLELRRVERAQKIQNLLALTRHHWELWSPLVEPKDLKRILDASAEPGDQGPVNASETLFVTFLLNHLGTSLRAAREGMLTPMGEWRLDVSTFFALPVPKRVWELKKPLLDRELVAFVEDCLKEPRN